jgi:4-amino-4-deoxy-L-arabinose transferase-like glycosyltransferase
MISFIKHYRIKLLILLILIVGFYFRFVNISKNPYGFFCDEASVGYNAYSILKSAKDEWGVSWPLFFKAFGEYKGPVMIYSTIPFVYLFGLSEFSVRIVSVIFGVLTIVTLFFLTKELFNQRIAVYSALFLAISPWHIHFSRVSLEGLTPFVFFTVLGSLFWLKYFKNKTGGYLSVLFFAVSLYCYFPSRIFIPIYGLLLLLISWPKIKTNYRTSIKLLVFGLILISPLVVHLFFGGGFSRWNQVKGDWEIIIILKKYFSYFSTNYLFFDGDINFTGQFITRHSIKGMGQLYLFQLPLLIFGIVWFIKNKFKKQYLMLLFWLLIFPFCDLLTNSTSPQATRTIIGVVPFQIISAVGLHYLLNINRKRVFRISSTLMVTIIIFISVVNFQKKYNTYPSYSSDYWGWQSGPAEIMEFFKNNSTNYNQLCLEGKFNAPGIFIKFYDPTDICHGKCQICGYESLDLKSKQLFAISKDSYDKLSRLRNDFNIKHTVYYPNKELAFIILDFNNK